MSDTVSLTRTPTLVHLSRKLKGIGKIEKCEGCGCYVDTIKEIESALDRSGETSPDALAAREVIDELKEKHKTTHDCIGCDPCYPVGVSNSLYAISDGESVEGMEPSELSGACDTDSACGCAAPQPVVSLTPSPIQPIRIEAKPKFSWPIETGDYRLGNVSGSVAIATLASEELYKYFSGSLCDESCAICGKVFTENIGIEKVVKNIIANRHISFLILCGQEAKGHQTGACIKGFARSRTQRAGAHRGSSGQTPLGQDSHAGANSALSKAGRDY